MSCPRCSAAVGADDLFCSSCGAHLRGTDGVDVLPPRRRGLGTALVLLFNVALLVASAYLVFQTLERYRGTARAATVRLGAPRIPGPGESAKATATKKTPTKDSEGVRSRKPRRARRTKAPKAARGKTAAPKATKPPKAAQDVPLTSPKAPAASKTEASKPGQDAPKNPAASKTPSAKVAKTGKGPASPGAPDAGAAKTPDAAPPKLSKHERRAAEFNAQSIRRVIRHYLPQLRSCYERATKRGQRVGGLIEIRFVVGADGKVRSSQVHSNTTGAKGLGVCIAATMKRWRFPRPVGGEVEFIYPFVFSSKS